MNDWKFLSYLNTKDLSSYGDGGRMRINKERQISNGDRTNNSYLEFSSHQGTHIDFPYHVFNEGKDGEDYDADFFVFNKVSMIVFEINNIKDYTITIDDFKDINLDSDTQLLILKTGMGFYRLEDSYWNSNPCFSPELASFIKHLMPDIRAIGFDSISLTGWKFREIGKIAHNEFLIKHNILVIEDMNLNDINVNNKINKVIVSPYRFENADGAPVTVFANIT